MPSESTDITDLILAHHEWFREQFARLDDAEAADAVATRTRCARCGTRCATKLDLHAIAEEEIFYPQLLRRGAEDPEEATLDAIGDHNDIRDGVHAAEAPRSARPSGGRPSREAREANDEHMAEEEREGIADFRANAPIGPARGARPPVRPLLRAAPRRPTASNVSDKDPQRYVDDDRARHRARARTGDGSLGHRQPERTTPAMTATDHLLRDLAPIPAKAWKEIDVRGPLAAHAAARRAQADATGRARTGGTHDRLSVGRTADIDGPPPARRRAPTCRPCSAGCCPTPRSRVPFTVRRREIDDIQRGATDAELDDLDRAARAAAITENRAVFHGWPAAGIDGPRGRRPGTRRARWATTAGPTRPSSRRPWTACAAKGIGGPYALAISPAALHADRGDAPSTAATCS